MDIICNIVLIILSMSITGTVLSLLWILLKTVFGKFLRSDILYFLLKLVIVSFYIPIFILDITIKSYFYSGFKNYYFFFSKPMKIVLGLIFAVMVVMIIIKLISWIKGNLKIKKTVRFRIPVKVNVNKIVDELRAEMNIKKKFDVYQAFVTTPFIYGFFKHVIYLKMENYDDEDIKIAIRHELTHYKQGDVFFKPIASIMFCINWFNPLAWYIKNEYNIWAEVSCDYKCFTKGGLTVEEYFLGVFRMAGEIYEQYMGIVSPVGGKSEIYKRTTLMSKYSRNEIKPLSLALISLFTVIISVFSLYEVSYAAGNLYNYVYETTQTEIKEYDVVTEDGSVEHVINNVTDDEKNYNATNEVFNQISYNDYKTDENINVDVIVNKNESWMTTVSGLNGDNIILVALTCELKDSVFEIGIIEPDGTVRYIECDNRVNHRFKVNKTGIYKIFITNIGQEDANVKCSIMISPQSKEE